MYLVSSLQNSFVRASHVQILHSFEAAVIFFSPFSGAPLLLHCSVPTICYAVWSYSPKTFVSLCPMIANIFTWLKVNIVCSVCSSNPVFVLAMDGLFT